MVNTVFGGPRSPHRLAERTVYTIGRGKKWATISFSDEDYEGIDQDHTEALVITLDVGENEVKRILVDNGSSVDMLQTHLG